MSGRRSRWAAQQSWWTEEARRRDCEDRWSVRLLVGVALAALYFAGHILAALTGLF